MEAAVARAAERIEAVSDHGQFMLWVDQSGDIWHATDWNWLRKGEWMLSNRDANGIRWYPGNDDFRTREYDLDEKARKAILVRFGLESMADKLPLEKLGTMSPKTLIALRRAIEEADPNLGKLEVFSDRLGDHIQAENCS